MSDHINPVWVIGEKVDGNIPPICFEIIGQARKLADELDAPVEVLLFGKGIRDRVDSLFHAGADVVHVGDATGFEVYQSEIYLASITALVDERKPQIMLIGSTFMGRELAPLIAAKLGTGLSAHCIDLVLDEDGILEQQIPAYGGLMSIICPDKRPQIATVARGVFPMPTLDESRSGKILQVDPPPEMITRVKTLEVVHVEPKGLPLETAPVVVAGGAGAGSSEGWQEIAELAEALNAALGSTRPAVDEGWTDLETMIGQSGRMVSPEIYIGIGLSGEQQHMVGIMGAKLMIAINNDPKSPVFGQVDIGIVEDCRQFVPALVKALKEMESDPVRATHVV
ncbi:MAG: electron transfer flavoprotein subunit alpha/FixB family protein [Chloroflexota bacterium]|nr:MAG: electron transfer flavoprotein subunit alpha/FixB family protein [Chloroflexota bacterium]